MAFRSGPIGLFPGPCVLASFFCHFTPSPGQEIENGLPFFSGLVGLSSSILFFTTLYSISFISYSHTTVFIQPLYTPNAAQCPIRLYLIHFLPLFFVSRRIIFAPAGQGRDSAVQVSGRVGAARVRVRVDRGWPGSRNSSR